MKGMFKRKNIGLLLLGGCIAVALTMALLRPVQSPKPMEKPAEKDFSAHTECNSIYYWKTGFKLTDEDRRFLKKHEVERIYLRFFDVAYEPDSSEEIVPIATTTFHLKGNQAVEIVPVVYITLDALREMEGKEKKYAKKIADRVLAMVKGNCLPQVTELQLDCDWTQSTRYIFFKLCEEARLLLHKRNIALSSTIRLHQLRTEAPPVDRGVLMLYNTGAIKQVDTKNSILDADDIAPYLKDVEYKLHLDFAYPTFSWGVWFRGDRFKAILRTTDYQDTLYYTPQKQDVYRVRKGHYLENHRLTEGDLIRLERPSYDEIMRVKKRVEQLFPYHHSSILYHLDMNNLNNYSSNEIKNMYGAR